MSSNEAAQRNPDKVRASDRAYSVIRYARSRAMGLTAFEAGRCLDYRATLERTRARGERYRTTWGIPSQNFKDRFYRDIGKQYGLKSREEARAKLRELYET